MQHGAPRGRGRGGSGGHRGRGGGGGRGRGGRGGAGGGFQHAGGPNKRPRYDQANDHAGSPVAFFTENMLRDPWAHLA
ncbi:hypothetical protein JCM3774_001958 [Rhodotorula dairenensis]